LKAGSPIRPVLLHDKGPIEAFLRRNVFLHIYEIGDLDDFFWPYTTWHALAGEDGIRQLAIFYTGTSVPTLLALTERVGEMRGLLRSIVPLLPARFYAHLSEGLADVFRERYGIESHGIHDKMALTDRSPGETVDVSDVVPLAVRDLEDIQALYDASYPGHWFEPRMLETGHYYGIREKGRLVCVAGVHVYSKRYRVAALGNITTHPDHRGRGLARRTTARLCRALFPTVDQIGLNVHAGNAAAIACYRGLGFERVASYEECMLEYRA
jgi:ribosomal protein S18 acetylase RimI-like enzyme